VPSMPTFKPCSHEPTTGAADRPHTQARAAIARSQVVFNLRPLLGRTCRRGVGFVHLQGNHESGRTLFFTQSRDQLLPMDPRNQGSVKMEGEAVHPPCLGCSHRRPWWLRHALGPWASGAAPNGCRPLRASPTACASSAPGRGRG